jgi:hypothetical protein
VATHPVGEAEEADGAGVRHGGDELGAGDVGAQRRLHDAVVEAQDTPPPGRHRHLALQQSTQAEANLIPSENGRRWGWERV